MPTRAEILKEVFKTEPLPAERPPEGKTAGQEPPTDKIPNTSASSASGSSSNAMQDRMETAKPKSAPSRTMGATPIMPANTRGNVTPSRTQQMRTGQGRYTRAATMPGTSAAGFTPREPSQPENIPNTAARTMPEPDISMPGIRNAVPTHAPSQTMQTPMPARTAARPVRTQNAPRSPMPSPVNAATKANAQADRAVAEQRPSIPVPDAYNRQPANQTRQARETREAVTIPQNTRAASPLRSTQARTAAPGARLITCLSAIPKTHPGYQAAQMMQNDVKNGKQLGVCKCPAMFYEAYRAALVQAGVPFLAKTGEPCVILTSGSMMNKAVQCLTNTYKEATMARSVLTAKQMENDVSRKTAGLRKNLLYLYGLTQAEQSVILSDMNGGQSCGIQSVKSGKCQIGVSEKAILESPDKPDMLRSALYAAIRCNGPLRKTNRQEEQQKQDVIRMTAANRGMEMLTSKEPYLYLTDRADSKTYYRISKGEMQKFRFAGKDPKTGKNRIVSEGSIQRIDKNFAQAFDQTVLSMTHPAVTKDFKDVKALLFGKPGPLQAVNNDMKMQQRGEKDLAHLMDAICRDRLAGNMVMQSDDTQRKVDLYFTENSALLKMAAGEPDVPHTADFTMEDINHVRAVAKANGVNLRRYMGAADRLSTFTVEVKRAESIKGNVAKTLAQAKKEQRGEDRSTTRSRGDADIGDQE